MAIYAGASIYAYLNEKYKKVLFSLNERKKSRQESLENSILYGNESDGWRRVCERTVARYR